MPSVPTFEYGILRCTYLYLRVYISWAYGGGGGGVLRIPSHPKIKRQTNTSVFNQLCADSNYISLKIFWNQLLRKLCSLYCNNATVQVSNKYLK